MDIALLALGAAGVSAFLYASSSSDSESNKNLQQQHPIGEAQDGAVLECEQDERSCRAQTYSENTVEGRYDNVPRMETVYKNSAALSMDCGASADGDAGGGSWGLAWEHGAIPSVSRHTGFSRIEPASPMVQQPPKREVRRDDEHFKPLRNDQPSWATATVQGVERARDAVFNGAQNKYNAPDGALDGYTPFDFENENGAMPGACLKSGGRDGFAQGQYQTPRTGASNGDHLRFAYIGTESFRGMYTHPLRGGPAAPKHGPVWHSIGKMRAGGNEVKKYELGEWRRDPVHQRKLGAKRHVEIMNVDLLRTNRQTGCTDVTPTSTASLHEELKTPLLTVGDY